MVEEEWVVQKPMLKIQLLKHQCSYQSFSSNIILLITKIRGYPDIVSTSATSRDRDGEASLEIVGD